MSDSPITETIDTFTASDGYPLRLRHWRPVTSPRGTVVCLHGIQSHAGWYTRSCSELANAGFEVRFLDRRGSGMNETERGHAVHAERLINDVSQFLTSIQCNNGPIFLTGISWGARLAAVVAKRRPDLLAGLTLLGPGIYGRVGPRWYQRMALRAAMAIGKTHHRVKIPLADPALFTNDLEWQEFIRTDAATLREITTSLVTAGIALERESQAAAEQICIPTLVMLAGTDRIIDNPQTQKWFKRLGTSETTLIEYPTAAHTLEFERECPFIADWQKWLATQVKHTDQK
ncbi:alpha/beta fold hydrolase [Thalassoroseus pseudoceratinae]|uniref:alpha/beta fold hydrolase n=1 Tax=Thalassoroseus pseudoceratinae TaxID=2713176 RepID=UPI00142249C4|nr:alpha/beta fold hydrolase [Thalassoroseus pseudoceratinae]